MTGSHKDSGALRLSRSRRIAGKSFLLLSLVISLLLAACSGGGSTPTQGNSGGSTALKVVAAPKGPNVDLFNPFFNTNQGSTWGSQGLLYEPLYYFNGLTSKESAWLATSYEFSSDVKSLTFHLRNDIKWSDGQAFTSADVKFTFDLMKTNATLDTQALWKGRLQDVTAPDPSTVVFTLQKPDSTAAYRVGGNVYIVPQHSWSSISGDPAKFTNDQNPVGTGPYTLSKYTPDLVQYKANPNYWGTKPQVKEIDVPAAADNATATLMIEKGEIDWVGVGWDPNTDAGFSGKDSKNNHTWFAPSNTVMLYMNLQKHPFDNVNVRQAISLAINRDELTQKANLYAPPANPTGVLTPNFNDWVAPQYLGQKFAVDTTKAWQLLGQAGYHKDANGNAADSSGNELTFNIMVVNGWTDWDSDGQLIQNDLAAIGITTVMNTVGGYTPYYNALQSGTYDAAISWTDPGPTPYYAYFDMLSSSYAAPAGSPITGGTNFERWSDPATDALLSQYSTSADHNTQLQAVQGLEKIMVDQLPAIPLTYNPYWYEYRSAHFTGWPDKANPYDIGSPYQQPDLENVVLHLKPNA